MDIVRLVILLAVVALAIGIAVTFYLQYREATGTVWERLLEAARDSATILWQKFTIVVSGIGSLIALGAEWLDLPSVKDTIQSALKPEYVAAFIVACALVSWFARKRTQ